MLAVQFRATVCVEGAAPVPERAIVAGEPVALLVTVTVPLSAPPVVGKNTTLKLTFCPALNVTGALAPLRLKAAPVSVILEMVTLEFPVLVTVTFFVKDEPVFTLPNARLVALNERVCDALTPMPLNAIVAGEFGALLTIETAPLTVPVEAGENAMLKLVDWPAFKEIGKASELVLKPLPVTLTWVIDSVPVPLFVS